MRMYAYVEGVGHDHAHAPASASARHLGRLAAALGISAAFMLLEFVIAFATSSLALLSDAAHMLTDVAGLGMALTAVLLAKRSKPTATRTFGYYRAEVLAALANALLLGGVAAYVLYEAIARFTEPPTVAGWPVLFAGAAGAAANIAAFLLLRTGARESINVRGAYLEVLADLAGSAGVLISALITITTGWRYADLITGVLIGLWVLPRTWSLARSALRILFQHSPERIDVDALADALRGVPGAADVHDLHVWTLTSGMEVASAHLTAQPGATQDEVLVAAQDLLAHAYGIEHATLQVESPGNAQRCRELSW